jgi:hypothetical protein
MNTQSLPQSQSLGNGAVLTAFAAVLFYAFALHNGFAFDDVVLIPGDPRVTGTHIGRLLTTSYWNDSSLALYRPLTSVTFALDWYVSKGSAAWFHFTNMLWHVAASVLAYLLLMRFFRAAAATAGGVLFALHPVHVEAVANIVGRSELIADRFFVAACLIWTACNLPRTPRLVLTIICYALAMCAKESAIVLPGVLFVLDYWREDNPSWRRRAPEYIAFALTLAAFMTLRHFVVGSIEPGRLDPSIEVANTWWLRTLTALQAWPVELKVLVFPLTLLADYGPRILLPIQQWTPLAVIGLTMVIVTVGGGIVALLQRKPLWALGLLWFPITILTVSNLIVPIGVLVAERTLYLPSFAICMAAAALFDQADARAAFAIAVAIAVAFAVRSIARIPDWTSTDAIMSALVRDRPDAFRGEWHMARMARSHGQVDKALGLYDKALRLWPYREGLVEEAAAYGTEHNRVVWAREVAHWGTQRWPRNVNLQRTLAANAIDMGDTVTARNAVSAGLHIAPKDSVLNAMWRAFGAKR